MTVTLGRDTETGDGGRPPSHGDRAGDTPGGRVGRRWPALVWVCAFALLACHDAGRMTFDTKLGVNIDPVGFYARLWHLWNPLQWFGGLQDQYIGYVFPMGAFYLLGHLLHAPIWITERLWMSLLVTAAFLGLVRLAEALGIGSRRTRLLAGVIFALWPTFTILVGSTSAAIVPGVLATWAVLPLLDPARTARVAAMRSGVVVLCMGGVNAVCTLAAIALPGMYILTRPGPRRWRLTLWWSLAVLLASLWWLVPLLYQGKYGADFLPYIEQAVNTTQTTAGAATLRGSGNWVAYLGLGGPWLSAGWQLVNSPWPIVASAVAAATGLAGLARRDLPEGPWLRLTAGLTTLIMMAGYWGPLGGPFQVTVHHLLDGPLAPLRNVFKFEPALAATLALAMAHVLTRVRLPWPRLQPVAATVLALGVLAGLGLPYVSGSILQPGAFKKVPGYWQQTASFLKKSSPRNTALVVPADSHGLYAWGKPIDDPLEPLARSPWAQRDLVPFTGGGVRDLTDAVEHAIGSGAPSPGLPAFLARAGIRYVVVRNDLDSTLFDHVPTQVVHRTLDASGFVRAASFGPSTLNADFGRGTSSSLESIMPAYPAVEVFQAADPRLRPAGPASVAPTAATAVDSSGPASLLQLANQGLLGSEPVVSGDQRTGSAPAARAYVTDDLRRGDTVFGLIGRNTSYTYTPTEKNPPDDPHRGAGLAPRQLLPPGGRQTVAELSGAAKVTSSSYGSWLWQMPEYDPVNAFDGDPSTAWAEGRPDAPNGQWTEIAFDRPMNLSGPLQVRLLADGSTRQIAGNLTVTTDAGRAVTSVRPTDAPQPLNVPAGTTRTLRVTLGGVHGGVRGGSGAGISEVTIPGVQVHRYLRSDDDPASHGAGSAAYSFHRDAGSPLGMPPAPERSLMREFTADQERTAGVRASAVAVPGSALDALVSRHAGKARATLHVSADSTFASSPALRPQNLLDGSDATGWIADRPSATLHLAWKGSRRLDELQLAPAAGMAAAPSRIRVNGRELNVPADGDVRFPSIVTDHIDLAFTKARPLNAYNAMTGTADQLPVGLAEIRVPGLAGLTTGAPTPSTKFTLPCGKGPDLVLDGHRYPTRTAGTFGDLTSYRPLPVQTCTKGEKVNLSAGPHRLTSPATGPLAITDLSLDTTPQPTPNPGASPATKSGARPGTKPAASSGTRPGTSSGARPATSADARPVAAARSLRVGSWGAEKRSITVGAGSESYLEVHEAANLGWTATLGGHRLRPVTLDGWQQGFVLPAGAGGAVRLTFTPAAGYHLALIVAATAVAVLLALALLAARRRPRDGTSADHDGAAHAGPGEGSDRDASVHAASADHGVAVQSGPGDRRGVHAATSTGRVAGWIGLAGVAGLLVVVGGGMALAVPVVALLGWWRPRWVPWLAFGAMTVAGVFAAAGARPGVVHGTGVFGAPAQAAALVALAAALTPLVHTRRKNQH